jgi:predicted NBD/HSP70 family sugar kinase
MKYGIDAGASTLVIGASPTGNPLDPQFVDVVTIPTTNHFPTDAGNIAKVFTKHGPAEELGVAAAGRWNTARTHLLYAGNLTGWVEPVCAGVGINEIAPNARVVMLGNDAEGQAQYEALNNPYLYEKDFIYWAVGTGIGTARVTWARLGDRRVPVCLPMEGQHIVHDGPVEYPNPVLCGCGQFNCTERLGSGAGIEQRFGVPPWEITEEQWQLVAANQAYGLARLLTAHLVDTVVFGGGMAEKDDNDLFGWVQSLLPKYAVKGVGPEIVPATCTKLGAAVAGLALLTSGKG